MKKRCFSSPTVNPLARTVPRHDRRANGREFREFRSTGVYRPRRALACRLTLTSNPDWLRFFSPFVPLSSVLYLRRVPRHSSRACFFFLNRNKVANVMIANVAVAFMRSFPDAFYQPLFSECLSHEAIVAPI